MVELKIGPPTKVVTYVDTYEISVKYMHGDADAYSEGGGFYPATSIADSWRHDDLKRDILALNFVSTEPFTSIYDTTKERKAIFEFFENHGWSKDEAETFIDNFIIGDSTNDHQSYASIQGYDVFYHDDKAVKHDVEVTIDVRPL